MNKSAKHSLSLKNRSSIVAGIEIQRCTKKMLGKGSAVNVFVECCMVNVGDRRPLAVVWSPNPHHEEAETSEPRGSYKVTWLVRAQMGQEFRSSN